MEKKSNLFVLIGCIIGCLLLGISGSLFTFDAMMEWYPSLVKPSFTPPNWVFGPVWTVLFSLLGVSIYMIWQRSQHPLFKKALILFIIQFALNIFWNLFFFGLRSPIMGLLEILILFTSVILMIATFMKIHKPAGLLQIPYVLWLCVATALNIGVLVLN